MSFDYLFDIFGKFRKRETKIAKVEQDCIKLITLLTEGKISTKEFAEKFDKIRDKYLTLLSNTVDKDTPLWINYISYDYVQYWLPYQQIKWYYEEHPAELTGTALQQYQNIQQMEYDKKFFDKCKICLKELQK